MKRNQKPDRTSDRGPDERLSHPQPAHRSQSQLPPALEAECSSSGEVPRNGLQVLTFSSPVAGPPTLDCIENDGRRVTEEQSLVGFVEAAFDRKNVLELYGIDLRYAFHNPKTGRWERCLFSCALADMLELLAADDEFPFAFEATPSQGEVDWAELKARGQTTRPKFPLKVYLTPATPEALAAVADDDRMRVRRGRPPGNRTVTG